jgi:hypothetical protein
MKNIIISLVLILSACNSSQTQSGPNISGSNPNIVVQSDISFCKAGCEKLMSLPGPDGKIGCLEARPIIEKDGGKTTCEEFCTITEKNGRALDPKCWTTLQSCDEIEACRKDN